MRRNIERMVPVGTFLLASAFLPGPLGAAEPIKIVDLNPISGVMKGIGA